MLLSQPSPSPASGRLTDLPNINAQVASRLSKVGIRTADDLLNSDPYVVFDSMLRKIGPNLKKKDLATIVGACQGEQWNNVLNESVREYRFRKPKHIWFE